MLGEATRGATHASHAALLGEPETLPAGQEGQPRATVGAPAIAPCVPASQCCTVPSPAHTNVHIRSRRNSLGNMSPHDTLPVRVQWEKNGWEPRGYYVVRNEYNNYICTYTPTDGGKYLLGLSDSTAGGKQQYQDQTYTCAQIREIIRCAC